MTYPDLSFITTTRRPPRPSLEKVAARASEWRRSLRGDPRSAPAFRDGPWTARKPPVSAREPLRFDVGVYHRHRCGPPSLSTQCSAEALELLDSVGMTGDTAKARRFQELYHAMDQAAVVGDIALFRYAGKLLPAAYLAEQCDRNGLLLRLWNGRRGDGGDADAVAAAMVTDLLAAGARWNIRNEHGETPLHLAAVAHPKTLAVLCRHLPPGALADAGLFATGREGLTPLHRAARFNNGESARVLLSHGANASRTSFGGDTPRDVAVRFGASRFEAALDRWLEEWRSRPRATLRSSFESTHAMAPSAARPSGDSPRVPPASGLCGSTEAARGEPRALPGPIVGVVGLVGAHAG